MPMDTGSQEVVQGSSWSQASGHSMRMPGWDPTDVADVSITAVGHAASPSIPIPGRYPIL